MHTITWKGRLGPLELSASDHTFQPSTISTLMAKVLDVNEGDVVIDVGCGTGILGIIAALLGAERVYGVDASPDVVEVATTNARTHGVADRMEFFHGDLFAPLPEDVRADVIIGDVSGIPDALAADSGWFPSKTGGGPKGSELPVRMLKDARRWLKGSGRLLLPTGTLQDENAILDAARSAFGSLKKLIDKMIPLAGPLAESGSVRELIDRGVVKLTPRGSRFLWEARVWECAATDHVPSTPGAAAG
jgi:SAM-dependent methyltransferase